MHDTDQSQKNKDNSICTADAADRRVREYTTLVELGKQYSPPSTLKPSVKAVCSSSCAVLNPFWGSSCHVIGAFSCLCSAAMASSNFCSCLQRLMKVLARCLAASFLRTSIPWGCTSYSQWHERRKSRCAPETVSVHIFRMSQEVDGPHGPQLRAEFKHLAYVSRSSSVASHLHSSEVCTRQCNKISLHSPGLTFPQQWSFSIQ